LRPAVGESGAPLADGRGGDAEVGGDGGVGVTAGCGQDDPGPEGQTLGAGRSPRPVDQLGALVAGQRDGCGLGAAWHRELLDKGFPTPVARPIATGNELVTQDTR